MSKLRHTLIVFIVMLVTLGCDQATKSVAKKFLGDGQLHSFLGDTFRLEYAENSGAFLSLGASLPGHWRDYIFIAGVAIILMGILVYLLVRPAERPFNTVALAMVCGGGFSNLLDRICYDGRVVDFLNMGIGSLRTGIFNLADMAIMAGVAMLVLQPLFEKKDKQITPPA